MAGYRQAGWGTQGLAGAWGCGAFGGDPKRMAASFVHLLLDEGLVSLYQTIHIAIPHGNANAPLLQGSFFNNCVVKNQKLLHSPKI